MKRIQEIGLKVRAGFIVGSDGDSPDIFERQITFVQESRIVTAMVGMLNAPGGSRLYEWLEKEGRIGREITGGNTDFTTNAVPLMGYEKLFKGYPDYFPSSTSVQCSLSASPILPRYGWIVVRS